MALCVEHKTAVLSIPQSNYIFDHDTPGAKVSKPEDIQKSTESRPEEATSELDAASLQHMKADGAIIDNAQDVLAHLSHRDENVRLKKTLARGQQLTRYSGRL